MRFYAHVLVCLITSSTVLCGENQEEVPPSNDSGDKDLLVYRRLFQSRRQEHLEAINNILSLQDYEKQYKLITMVFEKLFEVLNGARFILQQANYIPGEKFPTEEQTREALSSVLENTAFFGELLLRLPDISHDIYDKKSEWKDAMGWAVGFCEQSNVFEGIHYKMLNLMSQELNIIPRDPDYVNPYAVDQKMLFQGSEPLEKKKKKEKKPRKRGPRLSSKQEL